MEPLHTGIEPLLIESGKTEFIATWETKRYQAPNEGYDTGRNVFQVRLTPDGAIEMRYDAVAERDGIMGVFGGHSRERPLDSRENPPASGTDSKPRVQAASVADGGSAFHVALRLTAPLPNRRTTKFWFGAWLITEAGQCKVGVRVDAGGHSPASNCIGYAVDSENTVDVYVPKLNLRFSPPGLEGGHIRVIALR
jgi:hypothetical protein